MHVKRYNGKNKLFFSETLKKLIRSVKRFGAIYRSFGVEATITLHILPLSIRRRFHAGCNLKDPVLCVSRCISVYDVYFNPKAFNICAIDLCEY